MGEKGKKGELWHERQDKQYLQHVNIIISSSAIQYFRAEFPGTWETTVVHKSSCIEGDRGNIYRQATYRRNSLPGQRNYSSHLLIWKKLFILGSCAVGSQNDNSFGSSMIHSSPQPVTWEIWHWGQKPETARKDDDTNFFFLIIMNQLIKRYPHNHANTHKSKPVRNKW